MGLIQVIGLIVVIGSHYGFMSVTPFWYYFWLFLVIAEVYVGVQENAK